MSRNSQHIFLNTLKERVLYIKRIDLEHETLFYFVIKHESEEDIFLKSCDDMTQPI